MKKSKSCKGKAISPMMKLRILGYIIRVKLFLRRVKLFFFPLKSESMEILLRYWWFSRSRYGLVDIYAWDKLMLAIEKSSINNKKEILKKSREIHSKKYPKVAKDHIDSEFYDLDDFEQTANNKIVGFLFEVLCFGILHKDHQDIEIVPETNTGQVPDFFIPSLNTYYECKFKNSNSNFRESVEASFSTPSSVSIEGIKRGLERMIHDAANKFKAAQGGGGVVLLGFDPGWEVLREYRNMNGDLDQFLGGNFIKDLENKYQLKITIIVSDTSFMGTPNNYLQDISQ